MGWLDALFRLLGGDVDARSFLKGDSADGRDDDEEGPLPLDEPIKHGGGTVPPGKAGVPGASSATGKKKGAEASSEDNKKRHEREA